MRGQSRKEMKSSDIAYVKQQKNSRNKSAAREFTPDKLSSSKLSEQYAHKPKQTSHYAQSKPVQNLDYVKQLDLQLSQLTTKGERMQFCINLFNLMHNNDMHLRCLQHNNTLTLYCLTERRVLCVNCTYGMTKHRTHKVIPLKDTTDYIVEDNKMLRSLIDRDLKVLQENIKNSQQNSFLLEKELKNNMEKLEQNFRNTVDELKEKYEKGKAKMQNTYDKLIHKSKDLEKRLEEFKFKIWETLSKIGIGKRNQSSSNQTDVIRQVFCVNLSEITSFEVPKITRKQLQRIKNKL